MHSARPLQDLVIPEVRERLEGTCERTTASDNEMGVPPRPFWNRSLGGERHVTFLQTPRRRGMLRYTLHLVEEAGVFFRCHEAGLPTAHHRRTRESRLQRPMVSVDSFAHQTAAGARQIFSALRSEGLRLV